jgi:hypothetical protein
MDPKETPIPSGSEVAIVTSAEARKCRQQNLAPKGGFRGIVVAHVPAGQDLANALGDSGVARGLLAGYADPSERNRYIVRIPRTGKNGAELKPSYKVPLAGNVVLAKPPAKEKPAVSRAAVNKPRKVTTDATGGIAFSATAPATAPANGATAISKRGKGA